MFFLNAAMVRAIHSDLIDHYGGSYGIRDTGLLESALARPLHLLQYVPESSVAALAATLGWGLIRNHAFLDGNKRIGFAAMVTFLKLNGFELATTEVEETAMVLEAAASNLTEQQWIDWIERVVVATP